MPIRDAGTLRAEADADDAQAVALEPKHKRQRREAERTFNEIGRLQEQARRKRAAADLLDHADAALRGDYP